MIHSPHPVSGSRQETVYFTIYSSSVNGENKKSWHPSENSEVLGSWNLAGYERKTFDQREM